MGLLAGSAPNQRDMYLYWYDLESAANGSGMTQDRRRVEARMTKNRHEPEPGINCQISNRTETYRTVVLLSMSLVRSNLLALTVFNFAAV